jgi:hypothetical protein
LAGSASRVCVVCVGWTRCNRRSSQSVIRRLEKSSPSKSGFLFRKPWIPEICWFLPSPPACPVGFLACAAKKDRSAGGQITPTRRARQSGCCCGVSASLPQVSLWCPLRVVCCRHGGDAPVRDTRAMSWKELLFLLFNALTASSRSLLACDGCRRTKEIRSEDGCRWDGRTGW